MGYTTPFTAVAGTAWKASDWNTYGRDNIAWMATDSPTCRAYNSAALTATTAVVKDITCNSERFDNAAMHSTSSSTERITVPTGAGGKYLVGGTGIFATSAGGAQRILWMMLNATVIARQNTVVSASATGGCSILTVYAASAADFFGMQAYQDSGGNLNITGDPGTGPEIFAFWLRT